MTLLILFGGVSVPIVPNDRVFIVPADDRIYIIPDENRSFEV